ncbi:hypothetical protein SAMN02745911_1183 [Aureimonas altamirensis DSM 21988]|uniref:Uncharacterized protein n=1 Tax=Aureimonas altamirensis DSM 21988 TaxID=1121026 RepID=A0ABY1I900_9HYPH|nr:hypothetical protein SAMN02745911_1183 [Aureimonas altamirensis DSM 21988]
MSKRQNQMLTSHASEVFGQATFLEGVRECCHPGQYLTYKLVELIETILSKFIRPILTEILVREKNAIAFPLNDLVKIAFSAIQGQEKFPNKPLRLDRVNVEVPIEIHDALPYVAFQNLVNVDQFLDERQRVVSWCRLSHLAQSFDILMKPIKSKGHICRLPDSPSRDCARIKRLEGLRLQPAFFIFSTNPARFRLLPNEQENCGSGSEYCNRFCPTSGAGQPAFIARAYCSVCEHVELSRESNAQNSTCPSYDANCAARPIESHPCPHSREDEIKPRSPAFVESRAS